MPKRPSLEGIRAELHQARQAVRVELDVGNLAGMHKAIRHEDVVMRKLVAFIFAKRKNAARAKTR